MENMRFKVGDRVRIKSLDWYNENKNKIGVICFDHANFIPEMSRYCGEILTISQIVEEYKQYLVSECAFSWTDEMIEGLVEEEEIEFTEEDKYWCDIMSESDPTTYVLPEGYIFKDENGNVINAQKIVLEKKKKEYPKTYKECCKVLNIEVRDLDILDNMLDTSEMVYRKNLDRLLNLFRKLLICRDAYWKIAGEEMGLRKPWEPTMETVYCISRNNNVMKCSYRGGKSNILEFPTPEMRDTFYENFKEEIEKCKELL